MRQQMRSDWRDPHVKRKSREQEKVKERNDDQQHKVRNIVILHLPFIFLD